MNEMISVIIPTHNRLDMLKSAINSVINQTYQQLEIIVVDDGSSDGTKAYLESLSSSDPRLIYIRHQKPKGGEIARNSGIKASRGDYIALLDDDDIWSKSKLEIQKKILDTKKNVGIVSCNNLDINEEMEVVNENIRGNDTEIKSNDAFERILIRNFIGGSSFVLIRKNVLEEVGYFTQGLKSAQEANLYIKIIKKGWDVYICKEYLLLYRIHNQHRISDNYAKKINGIHQLHEYVMSFKNEISEQVYKDINFQHLFQLRDTYHKHLEYKKARKVSWKMFKLKVSLSSFLLFVKSSLLPIKAKLFEDWLRKREHRKSQLLKRKWKEFIKENFEIQSQ